MKNLHDRLRASLVHLAVSAAIASTAALLVFLLWYPSPLQAAMGATSFFLLILAVDVILGPLLTFAVFNRAKKSLKFDLGVIVAVQIAALAYGMFTIYQGKPAFVTFNDSRFEIIRVTDLDAKAFDAASAKGFVSRAELLGKPRWVGTVPTSDPRMRDELKFAVASIWADLYVPLDEIKSHLRKNAKPLAELARFNKGAENEIAALTKKFGGADGKTDLSAIIDKNTAQILDVVRLKPWP
jgi:hypothetical protein